MTLDTSLAAIERSLNAATLKERKRCADVVRGLKPDLATTRRANLSGMNIIYSVLREAAAAIEAIDD